MDGALPHLEPLAWIDRRSDNATTAPKEQRHPLDNRTRTERAALVLEANGHLLVGPDNGVFSWVAHEAASLKMARIKPAVHRPEGV